MSDYLDCSLVVSALAKEVETPKVQAWLGRRRTADLTISDWIVTEVSSAFALKVRTGAFSTSEQTAALAAFRRLVSQVGMERVDREHFREAARLCERSDLALRAGDALHLAIALDRGHTLCTRDRRLAAAASAYGAHVELV